jgi:hypothetical protein
MVPMRHTTQALQIWAYSDVNTVARVVWEYLCTLQAPGTLTPVRELREILDDELVDQCAGSLVSWSRSDGWICHTRFDVGMQASAGFLGSLSAVSAAVRANPEGATTSSLKVECSMSSHIGDTSLADRVQRAVVLAASLFAAALEAHDIEYRLG